MSISGLKIVIIGGGMAGLAAAILLHDKSRAADVPFSVSIYELRPEPQTIGGAINLSPNALRILDKELNLYQLLKSQGCGDVKSAEMFSQSSGKSFGSVPFSNSEYDSLRITRHNLLTGLLAGVEERGIEVQFGKKLTAISETGEGVTATFADGTSASGDILLGCDGTHSATRSLHVDPSRKPSYTGISTAYGFSDTQGISPKDLYFDRTAITSGRRGSILTTYSDSKCETVYFASVMQIAEQASRDGWKAMGDDVEATKKEILSRFGDDMVHPSLKCLPEIVRRSKNVCFFPVWKLDNNPDSTWFSKRCLLLGDAAHAMPPQGQSIGLAFEDGVMIARLLVQSQIGKDEATTTLSLPTIFEKYVSIRRPRIDIEFSRANSGWETIKDIGYFKNVMREWFTWIYLSFFLKGFQEMYEYDITKVEI